MISPQMVVGTFLGAVYAGLVIWNVRMTGKIDKLDKENTRLGDENDLLSGKLTVADILAHDLRKEITIKIAEIVLKEERNTRMANGMVEAAKELAELRIENESLRLDYGFVKAENERFLTDLTKAVTKIPKHDPTTGRFVKKVSA